MCGIKNMHDKFLFCIIKYGKSGLTTFRSRYRVFSMPSGIHETPRSRQGRAGESLPPRDAILEEWRPAGALSNLFGGHGRLPSTPTLRSPRHCMSELSPPTVPPMPSQPPGGRCDERPGGAGVFVLQLPSAWQG